MDANVIARMDCPVLCVDTCSLLDIFRDPTRMTVRAHDHSALLSVVSAVETRRIICLVADQVRLEFADHDIEIQEEARRNLEKVRKQIDTTTEICAVHGVVATMNLDHLDQFLPRSRDAAERLLRNAISVSPGVTVPGKAYARLNANIAPAKRGKESSKDCLVYETYLEAMSALQFAGQSKPIVFLSSNTKDYRTEAGILKPEIAAEFGHCGCVYAPNISVAKLAMQI